MFVEYFGRHVHGYPDKEDWLEAAKFNLDKVFHQLAPFDWADASDCLIGGFCGSANVRISWSTGITLGPFQAARCGNADRDRRQATRAHSARFSGNA
jgi:hypothetical protein